MRDVPTITLDGRQFPIFLSVARQEAWAARTELTFDALLSRGLSPLELAGDNLRFLLEQGLEGGEARRHALAGGQALTVEPATVDRVLSLFAWTELASVLMECWTWPPNEPDPTLATTPSVASTPSDSPSPSPIASLDSTDSL
jgi:hypothetical protein